MISEVAESLDTLSDIADLLGEQREPYYEVSRLKFSRELKQTRLAHLMCVNGRQGVSITLRCLISHWDGGNSRQNSSQHPVTYFPH